METEAPPPKVMMEGWLNKKGGGTGILGSGIGGRSNWNKRWFVLNGPHLDYYESFDPKANDGHGLPKNKKGTVAIHNAKITTFPHKGDSKQKHTFVLEHPARRPFRASAPSEKLMYLWLDALKKASKLEFDEEEVNTDEYYQILGFDHEAVKANGTPDVKDIQKNYRKACLKVHPDKPTGSLEQFEKVQEAYEILISIKEKEEEDRVFTAVEFSVTVEKGPRGVGLGLVVQEDPKKGVINVTKVSDTIRCTLHDKEKFKHIQAGDTLTQVGEDRIKGWPLNRVVERLNDFRVPIGKSILMKFSRRIRKFEERSGDDLSALAPMYDPNVPLSPAMPERENSYADYPYTPEDQGIRGGVRDSECADPGLVDAEIREMGGDEVLNGQTARDKLHMSEVMRRGLEEENAGLYEEIAQLRDRCVQAEASQGSMRRQLEESECSREAAEQKVSELQKEVNALVAMEVGGNGKGGLPSGGRNVSWMEVAQNAHASSSAAQLQPAQARAQRLAVIAAQAHDTSSVMSKWQAKGGHHSAEAKLNRLEQRLASLGKGKPSMGGGPPAMPPAAPGAAEQQRISAKGQQLKDSLKQRLEFRPQKKHLVQNGILLK